MRISTRHIKEVAEEFDISPKKLKKEIDNLPKFKDMSPVDQGIRITLIAKAIAERAASRKKR